MQQTTNASSYPMTETERVTMTSGSNVSSYVYDNENRLKQVNLNGLAVLPAWYDGEGTPHQNHGFDH